MELAYWYHCSWPLIVSNHQTGPNNSFCNMSMVNCHWWDGGLSLGLLVIDVELLKYHYCIFHNKDFTRAYPVFVMIKYDNCAVYMKVLYSCSSTSYVDDLHLT